MDVNVLQDHGNFLYALRSPIASGLAHVSVPIPFSALFVPSLNCSPRGLFLRTLRHGLLIATAWLIVLTITQFGPQLRRLRIYAKRFVSFLGGNRRSWIQSARF